METEGDCLLPRDSIPFSICFLPPAPSLGHFASESDSHVRPMVGLEVSPFCGEWLPGGGHAPRGLNRLDHGRRVDDQLGAENEDTESAFGAIAFTV